MMSLISYASSRMFFDCTSFMTGTKSPCGVSVANSDVDRRAQNQRENFFIHIGIDGRKSEKYNRKCLHDEWEIGELDAFLFCEGF